MESLCFQGDCPQLDCETEKNVAERLKYPISACASCVQTHNSNCLTLGHRRST